MGTRTEAGLGDRILALHTTYSNLSSAVSSASKIQKPQQPAQKSAGKVVAPQDSVSPQETFFSTTTPLKTPRPGSSMAEMMEDLQNNGFLPEAQTASPESFVPQPLKQARPGSDMDQMVADLKLVGSHHAVVQVNSNGTIAMLEDSPLEQFVATTEARTHSAHSGHHDSHQGDALLGGHLSTEVIEQIGHHATHTTHVASELAGHGVDVGGDLAAVAGHGTDTVHAVSEVAHHAANAASAGHEVGNVVHHGVSEALGEAAITAGSKAAHGASQVANHLSTGLEVALGFGSVASGALAVPLLYNGVKELKAGIKEKDTEKTLEGVGNLAVGTRSAAAATVMAGMLSTSELVTTAAGVASQFLTPLGVVHGVIDGVLGVRDIAKGKTTEGLLKIAVGTAVTAAALGGGLPAIITAGVFLGAKVVYKAVTKNSEKKASETAASGQQTTPKTTEAKKTPAVTTQVASLSTSADAVTSSARVIVPNSDFYADFAGSSGGQT